MEGVRVKECMVARVRTLILADDLMARSASSLGDVAPHLDSMLPKSRTSLTDHRASGPTGIGRVRRHTDPVKVSFEVLSGQTYVHQGLDVASHLVLIVYVTRSETT